MHSRITKKITEVTHSEDFEKQEGESAAAISTPRSWARIANSLEFSGESAGHKGKKGNGNILPSAAERSMELSGEMFPVSVQKRKAPLGEVLLGWLTYEVRAQFLSCLERFLISYPRRINDLRDIFLGLKVKVFAPVGIA
jgi:hypothetical protein